MSTNSFAGISFDYTQLNISSTTISASSSSSDLSSAAAFAAQFATAKAELFDTLITSAFGGSSNTSGDQSTSSNPLLGTQSSSSDPFAALTGKTGKLSASGLNTSLFDPQSGYNMMTKINNSAVTYQAQFAELSQMGGSVSDMQHVGEQLHGITQSTSNADIQSQLQDFTNKYNDWVKRYAPDVQAGGLLANNSAAKVAVHELDQSMDSIFNGAQFGIRGMAELGLSNDDKTGLATLDTTKLNAMLTSNKSGVVNALQEFSANFAKSAKMLNEDGNFFQRQLGNLSGAIGFIAKNEKSWQAEFGTGDAAKPNAQVTQALAAYKNSTSA